MTYPTPVIIRSKLVRDVRYSNMIRYKEWKTVPIPETRGWVIQLKTLTNGIAQLDRDGICYRPKDRVRAYKVAVGIRSAPVWVRVEDVEFVEGVS